MNGKNKHPDREPGRIEELKKRLYSRSRNIDGISRVKLQEKGHDIPTDWETSNDELETMSPRRKKKPFLNKLLIFAALFFLAALGFAFFAIQSNFNSISSEKIDITASGPTSISAGDTLALNVTVSNRNDVSLEGARLLVEYPEDTRNPDDLSEELTREQREIGEIGSGGKSETALEAVLFGKEGDVKEITLGIEYRVPDSSALFYTEKVHEIEISSSPLTLIVEGPREVNSGEIIEFRATVQANITETIEDVLLLAEYPFGFQFVSATPNTTFDKNIWVLGDVAPGSTRTITIRGRISGQQDEERTLRLTLGLQSENNEKVVGTPFLTYQESVILRKPAVNLSFLLNGEIGNEFVVDDRVQTLRADISWTNNLASRLRDASIRVELDSSLIDSGSVSASQGSYRPSEGVIVWDSRSLPALQVISSGANDNVSFSFLPKDARALALTQQEPELHITITMKGTTSGENVRDINTSVRKVLKFMTDLSLSQEVSYVSGAFPPALNRETEYEVVWSVSNALNHVGSARVSTTLPSYVEWVGAVGGDSGNISFNSVGGRIVWNMGDVQAGAGFLRPAPEVKFRVRITPVLSHVGEKPTLIGEVQLSGTDAFVSREVGGRTSPYRTDSAVVEER